MKKNYVIYILIVMFLFLVGCSTPYQAEGFTGGYSELHLQDNIYKVYFRGNGYTSRERASNFALLRSAELTLEKGYKYFIIMDSERYNNVSSYTSPTTSDTTGSAFVSGNTATFNSQTTTYGGGTHYVSKPRNELFIMMTNEKMNNVICYDAQQIYTNIRKSYNLVKPDNTLTPEKAKALAKQKDQEQKAPEQKTLEEQRNEAIKKMYEKQ